MDGLTLIDASEVSVGKKKSKTIKKIPKGPIINILEDEKIEKIAKTDIISIVEKKDESPAAFGVTSKAIKIKEDIYYGPKNVNKNKFMREYKKLGLSWKEDVKIDNDIVSGWFNSDKSQYIIKLIEEGGFKRFKFHGCDSIYDYFVSLGAIIFETTNLKTISPSYQNKIIDSKKESENNCLDDENRFVGGDLWSGYRTRQLLKNMPDNWGVIWK